MSNTIDLATTVADSELSGAISTILRMDAINFLALRGLIERLPLPLVLFDNRSGVSFANDRFAEIFLSGQLDSPDLHRLAHDAGGAWQPVKLCHHDGRDFVACARAVAIADGVLLVFDEVGGPAWMQEIERLQQRITDLESLRATDPLTGAWNRVQLERLVDVEISRATRSGQPLTLVLLDIDHFKRVNDFYGHLTGDAVLKEFAGRIRQRMRGSDSLFRWGGDEFVVLAASVGYRGGAALAEGLRRTIADERFAEVGPITASLGVTEYIEGESAETWFERTDQALYAAKTAGRNRMQIDRQGSSDLHSNRAGTGVLRLYWLESYECGEPTIDAEHREQHSEPGLWRATLDSMLARLVQHFQAEEALLALHGYERLAEHQRAHAGLLRRADDLKAAVESGEATLGHLVNFLVNDVIALHMLKVDKDFYLPLPCEYDGGADRARS
jgi:diguanylate cyclase (GGDEF)-like protein/hemerythrin-like metal-binding protein